MGGVCSPASLTLKIRSGDRHLIGKIWKNGFFFTLKTCFQNDTYTRVETVVFKILCNIKPEMVVLKIQKVHGLLVCPIDDWLRFLLVQSQQRIHLSRFQT